jgi:hypothetical protein
VQAIFLSLALILCGADAALESFVEQSVDTIAVVHVKDGAEMAFFFDFVQGEWACLDHRWLATDMLPGRVGDRWSLAWRDDGDSCWRLMLAEHWYETWVDESPLAEVNNRPWFRRLLVPGLMQPRRAT